MSELELSPISANAETQQKLQQHFNAQRVEIIDNSWQHAGHAGMQGITATTGTHLHITIVADAFEGQNTIARHRMVQKALKQEFSQQLHALQIKTFTPQEWADAH